MVLVCLAVMLVCVYAGSKIPFPYYQRFVHNILFGITAVTRNNILFDSFQATLSLPILWRHRKRTPVLRIRRLWIIHIQQIYPIGRHLPPLIIYRILCKLLHLFFTFPFENNVYNFIKQTHCFSAINKKQWYGEREKSMLSSLYLD